MKKTNPSRLVAVTARNKGGTYIARAGKGGYARTASSTNAAYWAALKAAAKFFECPESHVILAFRDDAGGRIEFEAFNNRKPVTFVEIAFEDKGQDFLHWEIAVDSGQVVDCTPCQYSVWAKCRVLEARTLKVGDRPDIAMPGEKPVTLNYAVVAIERKGGAK